MKYFRQCTLRSGTAEMIAWIEEYGAKEGYLITLEDTDEPARLWKVVKVYDVRMSSAAMQEMSHRADKWRKQVDI
jgi:hypothetical protein